MEPDAQRAALQALIDRTGASCAALSRLIGRNVSYLQQYLTKGSPRLLAERDRALLARYFGVAEVELGGHAGGGDALAQVARLDVGVSAGPGGWVDGEARRAAARFDPALLRQLGVRTEAASVVRVTGRSMEPTLSDGDEILVDRDRRRPGPRGSLFVLRRDGAVQVKRLRALGADIEVASDNPEFPPPAIVRAAEVEVVGRVVWLGRALL